MSRAYYEARTSDGTSETFRATPHTAGPWDDRYQHGGPPAALLGRACERLASSTGSPLTVSRFTMELLGPVPVGEVLVRASVIRPGRSVDLCRAELVDLSRERAVALAHVWRSPSDRTGPASEPRPPAFAGPEHGTRRELPPSWHTGYLDAVEWSWLHGAVADPGPAQVWMRPRVPLLDGEPLTWLQRLLVCVDSASGVGSALDPGAWGFLNTDLTVHLLRALEGDWVGLEARTDLGGGSAAVAHAEVFDQHGLVGRSAQSLFVSARS